MMHYVTQVIMQTAAVVLFFGIAQAETASTSSSPSFVKTVEGCGLYEYLKKSFEFREGISWKKEVADPNYLSVSATVPCSNGKLQGEGTVKFFYRGHQYWEWNVSEKRGIQYEDGVLTARIRPEQINVSEVSCNPKVLTVRVPAYLAFEHSFLWDELERSLVDSWRRSCQWPAGKPIPFYPTVYADDSSDRNPWLRTPTGTMPTLLSRGTIEEYRRYWQSMHLRSVDAAREEQKQADLRKASADRLARQRELARSVGDFQVVSLRDIEPNPFVWKGKQIAVCVSFRNMLDANTAMVLGAANLPVLVTGVPTTRFTQPTRIFLVAKVVGLVGGAQLHLQYVRAIDQKNDFCNDFLDPPW